MNCPKRPSACRSKGFSLLELLAVVAVIGVVTALLFPALSQARQRVTVVSCLGNLNELGRAGALYSADFHESLPANGTGSPDIHLDSVPVSFVPKYWVEGREGGNFLDRTGNNLVNEKVSLLAPYIRERGVFRCPGDNFSIRYGGSRLVNPRNYALNAFVGWVGAPVNGQGDDSKFQIFEATSDAPQPDAIFTFGEIHPLSICHPFFGVQMQAAAGVYHVPGNYHGRFSNFGFLDGHIKAHVTGVPGTASKPDMLWLAQHASVRN